MSLTHLDNIVTIKKSQNGILVSGWIFSKDKTVIFIKTLKIQLCLYWPNVRLF